MQLTLYEVWMAITTQNCIPYINSFEFKFIHLD